MASGQTEMHDRQPTQIQIRDIIQPTVHNVCTCINVTSQMREVQLSIYL